MQRELVLIAGLFVLNVGLLLVGLGQGSGAAAGPMVRVGLVFDVGGLGDKSFNDAAFRGLERARDELGVQIRTIEPGDGSDRESALRQLAAEGSALVIGVGFIFTDDLRKLAREFPGTRFAGVDFSASPNERTPPNLSGLRFREHEGSFLVGVLAGLMTKSRVVGFVGGMQIPLIRKFEAGYTAGVRHVCKDCRVLVAYAGTEPKAFADPVMGRELASAQFDRSADIVYHASGKTGSGVIQAARERKKWAIGVDSDQFHEAPCCVLTSMVKRVDVAVFRTIEDVLAGRFQSGVREFGLAEDGVAFVLDANNRPFFAGAGLSVLARVAEIAQDIIASRIEVPSQ